MKKSVLMLGLVSFLAISSKAQDLKAFKVDVSLGYAMPSGKGSKAGVLFAVEPKYAVAKNIAVGLRMEAAVVARGLSSNDNSFSEAEVKAAASYVATGDYYFSNNYNFRPFAGVGGGL